MDQHFSTRAEFRIKSPENGFDVIGMTNFGRKQNLGARSGNRPCYKWRMITDYDCWKIEEEPVSAPNGLRSPDPRTPKLLRKFLIEVDPPNSGRGRAGADHTSLDKRTGDGTGALWPKATEEKLRPIFGPVFVRVKKFLPFREPDYSNYKNRRQS